MDMVLAKSSIAIASRYAELVTDAQLRDTVFQRIRTEWQASVEALLAITGHRTLLEGNPLLARSIRNRFPYLDPLNHVQVELLRRHRGSDSDERVLRGIQLTINGIAAGLRNTGEVAVLVPDRVAGQRSPGFGAGVFRVPTVSRSPRDGAAE